VHVVIFLTRGKLLTAQKLQKNVKSVWQWTLLWLVVIDKTMQQNRVGTVGTRTKKLKHPRSSPPIACPTRSRTEEHLC